MLTTLLITLLVILPRSWGQTPRICGDRPRMFWGQTLVCFDCMFIGGVIDTRPTDYFFVLHVCFFLSWIWRADPGLGTISTKG